MSPSYDPQPATQPTLPLVRGEAADGQLELHEPGPRIELDDGGDMSPPPDPRQGSLAYTGVMPGARFRKPNTGEHVRASQLDLRLEGIAMRLGRASTWDVELTAHRTMLDLKAQTYGARELGDRMLGLPPWARGRWDLTPNEEKVLAALWVCYRDETCGCYELETTLASDLGFSERTLRHILNGRRWQRKDGSCGESIGLVERGLVTRVQTWRAGTGERPSDHHWLLLRIGPAFEAFARPLVFELKRPPRRSGYSRAASRRAAALARQQARRLRYERATGAYAIRRRRDATDAARVAQRQALAAELVAALSPGATAEGVQRRWAAEPVRGRPSRSRPDEPAVWYPSTPASPDASDLEPDASQSTSDDGQRESAGAIGVRSALEQGRGAAGPSTPKARGRSGGTPSAIGRHIVPTTPARPAAPLRGSASASGLRGGGACGPTPLLERRSDADRTSALALGSAPPRPTDGDTPPATDRPRGAGAPACEPGSAPAGGELGSTAARGWLRRGPATFAESVAGMLERLAADNPTAAAGLRLGLDSLTRRGELEAREPSPLQRDDGPERSAAASAPRVVASDGPPRAVATSTRDGSDAAARLDAAQRALAREQLRDLELFASVAQSSPSPASDASAASSANARSSPAVMTRADSSRAASSCSGVSSKSSPSDDGEL